jgi:putative membrane protein
LVNFRRVSASNVGQARSSGIICTIEGTTMFAIRHSFLLATALSLPASAALAQDAKPTDPQIAHIAYTAGQIDIQAAELALKKTHNKAVKGFAEEMARDHAAVNKQALALVKKLNVTPEDNATSKSLAEAAAAKREELSGMSGSAFDKAYAQNEVAYHQTVNGALKSVLIPNAENGDLRNLLQTGLKLFQEHEHHAEHLVSELK